MNIELTKKRCRLYKDYLALKHDMEVAWNSYLSTKMQCYRDDAILCEELMDIAQQELIQTGNEKSA